MSFAHGPIVAVLGGIDNILWFTVAVVGSLVTMTTVLLLKRNTPVIAVDIHSNTRNFMIQILHNMIQRLTM